MSVRQLYVAESLQSIRRLESVIMDMTLDELLAAIKLEAESKRRKAMLRRLICRATRMNELAFRENMKEYYNGT